MSDEYHVYHTRSVSLSFSSVPFSKSLKDHGCNGNLHIIRQIDIFFDEAGEIKDIKDPSFMKLGSCNQSCGSEYTDSFIYPPENEE